MKEITIEVTPSQLERFESFATEHNLTLKEYIVECVDDVTPDEDTTDKMATKRRESFESV